MAYCYAPAAAAEFQTLIPLNGPPVAAELVDLDTRSKLTFRSADRTRSLPWGEFVRWGHPVPPKPQIMVALADGGRLLTAAAWAGGAPVRLEGEALVVLTDIWDEVRLPRSLVRGVLFAQRNHPHDREHLEDAVRGSIASPTGSTESDAVFLTNGDRVFGNVVTLSGGALELSADSGTVKLPLSRVEAVVFGVSGQPSAIGRQSQVAIGTSDGTLLNATQVVADEQALSVEIAGGLKLSGGSANDVVFIQSPGGAFVYLSDLEPGSYRHVPYLAIEWPFRRNRNVRGEALSSAGSRYLKGLGMHSASRVTYQLDGKYRRFDAMVAIDDSAGRKGSVTFGVYVSIENQWKSAFTSETVRGGDPPQSVSVDVDGAQALTLTVDFADRGDELDRANWLDARLVKK